MNSEQQAFIKVLEQNENDTETRLVYADWLEEHGLDDEADRQRKWPSAKKWLIDFCDEYNQKDSDYERHVPYEELLQKAVRAISDDLSFYTGNNDTMCEGLRANRVKFWTCISIVTGIPLTTEEMKESSFSCAC